MKKKGVLLLLVCNVMLLSGCWDRTEVNDNAFVVASSLDKGEKELYRVSVQIPLPSSMGGAGSSGGGGGTSGEGPVLITQGTGKNSRDGIDDIQRRLSRNLFFSHRRVFIIGEELAKAGISESLSAVFIQPQSRLSTFIVISKGDAAELLKAEPRMEQFSAEAIREMAKSTSNSTIIDTIQDLDRPGKDAVVPLVERTGTLREEEKGKEVVMENFAVFKGDKLSFITNNKEAQGMLWLLERMKKKTFTFSALENKEISVEVIDNSVKTDVDLSGVKPSFELTVQATGTLIENEPNLRIEDPKTYQHVINKMEQKIKDNITSLLNHSLSKGTDVYGFGWYLYRRHNKKWENLWKDNWEDVLPELTVKVKIEAEIQRTTNSGKIEKE